MSRNLKVLGLALVAVFAMSAMVASAASATTHRLTAETATADLTGNQTVANQFKLTGATVTCNTVKFSGTAATLTEEITVHPTYEGNCQVSPIGSATINTEGCNYTITGETNATGHAPVHIVCSGSNEITINGPCVIHVKGGQTPTGGVTFTNGVDPTKGDVTVKATVTGIHVVVTTASPAHSPESIRVHTPPLPTKAPPQSQATKTAQRIRPQIRSALPFQRHRRAE